MKQLVNPFGRWWNDQPEEFISFKILREFVGDDADCTQFQTQIDGILCRLEISLISQYATRVQRSQSLR